MKPYHLILVPTAVGEKSVGVASFLPEMGPSTPVRPFSKSDLRTVARLSSPEVKRSFALLRLRGALDANDPIAIEESKAALVELDIARERAQGFVPASSSTELQDFANVMARYLKTSPDEALRRVHGLKPGPNAAADIHLLLSYEITQIIGFPHCQMVQWWHMGAFQPAIYCTSLHAAFCVHTFFVAPSGSLGYRVCPYCSNPFLQERTDQEYCIPAHREAYRNRRAREKKKRTAAEGGNNVTAKAR